MIFSKLSTGALVLASLSGLTVADDNEGKVIGTFIFGRHGDRLAKPSKVLTTVGIQELREAGSFYHDRYFNTSSSYHIEDLNATYQSEQLLAAAPGSAVLQNSQQAFLQGLYPPLDQLDVPDDTVEGSSLSNGTTKENPYGNFQYVVQTTYEEDSPNAIKISGVENCKAYEKASESYFDSEEFKKLNKSTYDFYQSLYPLVEGILNKTDLNYGQAYKVFDNFVVNNVHNETFAKKLKDHQDDFDQVRFLQDQYTKGLNYNSSNSDTILGGKSLAGAVVAALQETESKGLPLVTYYAGSYNVFYQLFAVLGLYDVDESTFTGLVNYGATAVFELVEKDNDKFVRFGLRNGTESSGPSIGQSAESPEFKTYPILGDKSKSKLIPYNKFVSKVKDKALNDISDWCSACGAWDLDMCVPHSKEYLNAKAHDFKIDKSKLSLAGAGGIGAGVTIGVFALAGALLYLLFARKKQPSSTGSNPEMVEGKDSDSYNTSNRSV